MVLAKLAHVVQPFPDRRYLARSAWLILGLALYGFSDGLLVVASLGLAPWDVLHQGLARTLGGQVGTWSIIVGAVVLVGWIPLRQRPGIGTVGNVVLVGLGINATVAWVAVPDGLAPRIVMLVVGIVANGVATGLYIGAGLGPGPRDGLMTGLAARGHSVRVVRTLIEATVLLIGWLLGGTVGWGTLAYALAIGPIAHVALPLLRLRPIKRDAETPSGRPADTHSLGQEHERQHAGRDRGTSGDEHRPAEAR